MTNPFTVKSAVQSLANGASWDFRPPVGETWIVTSAFSPLGVTMQATNGTILVDVTDTGTLAVITDAFIVVTNSLWLRISNSTGSATMATVSAYLAPSGITAKSAIVSGPGSAIPSAGNVMILKDIANSANTYVYDSVASATSAASLWYLLTYRIPDGNSPPIRRPCPKGTAFTATVYPKVSGGNAYMSWVEVPSTLVTCVTALYNMSSTVTVRPAVGETWIVSAASTAGMTVPLYLTDGTINAQVNSTYFSDRVFELSNSVYLKTTTTTTGYAAIVGIKFS